jgi:Domain of unknown function (DUF3127)
MNNFLSLLQNKPTMDITGKVTNILAEESGQGKNGTWRKLSFVIETQGQYPKKVCFQLWGDKIDGANLKADDVVTVSFDPESREFNGKWYTDLKAWKVMKGAASTTTNSSTENEETTFIADKSFDEGVDDLPF